jgi:hypothetical protein
VGVKLGLTMKQIDVKSVDLQGDTVATVIIELAEIVYPDMFLCENVGVLKKLLYRLKHALLL